MLRQEKIIKKPQRKKKKTKSEKNKATIQAQKKPSTTKQTFHLQFFFFGGAEKEAKSLFCALTNFLSHLNSCQRFSSRRRRRKPISIVEKFVDERQNKRFMKSSQAVAILFLHQYCAIQQYAASQLVASI